MTHKRRCLSSRGSGTASAGSGCSTMGYRSLHHRPGNAAWRPEHPESDLKYETNGLNSPLERCRTRRVPAAAFQPSLAAAHRQNGDTPFPAPHGGGACLGEKLALCGLGCTRGLWMDSCQRWQQHVLWLPWVNQVVNDFCYMQHSKL